MLTGPLGVIGGALRELFAPGVCPLCREGEVGERFGLCPACLSTIRPVGEPSCPVCALPFDGVGPSHACSLCESRPPAFTASVAAGRFEGALKDGVHRFKYGGDATLKKPLTELFAASLGDLRGEFSFSVPVPCHPVTLRKRGFDLPALLSRRAAGVLGAAWEPGALRKTSFTAKMAGVSFRERKRVAVGLYVPAKRVSGRVLLVDDVVTSTITVRAAARALKRAGATEVVVAALGRTPAPVRWRL